MGSRPRTRSTWTDARWITTAAVAVVLLTVAAVRFGSREATPPQPVAPLATGVPAPDISTMTPRERANALFDRIMSAAERGDTAEIEFFRPMALGAYALLGSPDNDTRYDLGMIHVITGELDSARAQADMLEQTTPRYLLGSMLRLTLAQAERDEPAMRRAYRAFLDYYDEEIAAGNQDYADHARAVAAFLEEARREAGASN